LHESLQSPGSHGSLAMPQALCAQRKALCAQKKALGAQRPALSAQVFQHWFLKPNPSVLNLEKHCGNEAL